jgi:hypothetical protein
MVANQYRRWKLPNMLAPAAAGERDLETLESSALKPWPLACSAEYGSLSNPISGTRTGLAMP